MSQGVVSHHLEHNCAPVRLGLGHVQGLGYLQTLVPCRVGGRSGRLNVLVEPL